MRQEFLPISGMTTADRHQVPSDVTRAISATGGWVADHTQFSNIAITIQFSLPSRGLDEFRKRIAEAGIRLNKDSLAKLQAMAARPSPGPKDVGVSLNITFIHNEPDLRKEIPPVPG